MSIIINRGVIKISDGMANSVDSDELSHLYLHSLQRCLCWSERIKKHQIRGIHRNIYFSMKSYVVGTH